MPHLFVSVKTLTGKIQFSEQLYNYSHVVKVIFKAPLKFYFVNFVTLVCLINQFHLYIYQESSSRESSYQLVALKLCWKFLYQIMLLKKFLKTS